MHQGCKLVDMDFKNRRAWITRSKPSTIFDVGYSLLIGADGTQSKVRQLLQAHDPSLACEEVGARMVYQAFARLPLGALPHLNHQMTSSELLTLRHLLHDCLRTRICHACNA